MKTPLQSYPVPDSGTSVPKVSAILDTSDYLGAVMVRWGINRNKYRVNPGLYAIGTPGPSSDIFVTANYKLSFDTLRKNLESIDGWILVLDTRGINVWCAAGKGTFGTQELVSRIKQYSVEKLVSHRRIIVPQLGATGVAAHKVKEETGFNVHYGPVRASDINKFISNGYRADKDMRKVKFGFRDRVKLIPNDFIYGKYLLSGAMAAILLISGTSRNGFHYNGLINKSIHSLVNIFLAYCSGIVLTPIMLPWLPSRRFSVKGFYSGTLVFLVLLFFNFTGKNIYETLSWFFIINAVSSFLAMNFTGSSTYTSLSGVKKEMRTAVPVQIVFAITGIVLQIVGKLNQ